MMELWNKKDLEAPLVNSYKTSPQEIGKYSLLNKVSHFLYSFSFADVEPLIKIFREASTFFSNQTFLQQETALLSRCIYKTKTKFRSEKGNKEMQKLNRALLQYLNINFAYHVQNFKEMLPPSNEQVFYLPTKNMLDYILVRLQGIMKLMSRAIECAKRAALYLEQKMPLGQFWKVDFVCIALVSRLRVLAVEIIKFSWKFFNTAIGYSTLLKNSGAQWLSSDYVFSLNFKDYVSDEVNLDENSQIQLTAHKEKTVVSDLREPTFSEIFLNNNTNELKIPVYKPANVKKKVKNEGGNSDGLLNINTVEDLERFLNSENSKRESSPKLCYLNNLDGLQWNIVRKQLKRLLSTAVNKKKQSDVKKIMHKVTTVIKKARIG